MISSSHFGNMPDGQAVECYSLSNANQASVRILTLGGIIQSWQLPGDPSVDIVLGLDSVEAYLNDPFYLGTVVGRYANRIAKGRFSLGDESYVLPQNLGGNTLHGGTDGFHHRLWQVDKIEDGESPLIQLSLLSPDGDQGFPGNLTATVTYQLTPDNGLKITYKAESDKDTVFNPTQHSYFNLGGHQSGACLHNLVQVNASRYTPADGESIPTGECQPVDNTPFDLRQPVSIDSVMAKQAPEILATNGLDHNWCLDDYGEGQQAYRQVASLSDPNTGRCLTVFSTMPGIQVYSANFLGEKMPGKSGALYGPYHAVCLETQYYPDSPNKAAFPSARLKAGEKFVSRTDYQVSG